MRKPLLPILLLFALFSGCSDEEKEDNPTPTPVTEVKPKVADVETISATVEANGSVTLTGKINKVNPTDLDYGFISSTDSSMNIPPIKLILKKSKPVVGTYTMVIAADDYRFVKGTKYYFCASVEVSNLKYQKNNIKSFVFPK